MLPASGADAKKCFLLQVICGILTTKPIIHQCSISFLTGGLNGFYTAINKNHQEKE
jgi:hypothetical protein